MTLAPFFFGPPQCCLWDLFLGRNVLRQLPPHAVNTVESGAPLFGLLHSVGWDLLGTTLKSTSFEHKMKAFAGAPGWYISIHGTRSVKKCEIVCHIQTVCSANVQPDLQSLSNRRMQYLCTRYMFEAVSKSHCSGARFGPKIRCSGPLWTCQPVVFFGVLQLGRGCEPSRLCLCKLFFVWPHASSWSLLENFVFFSQPCPLPFYASDSCLSSPSLASAKTESGVLAW